jgi:3-methyladenine DNA glycosylase Tag
MRQEGKRSKRTVVTFSLFSSMSKEGAAEVLGIEVTSNAHDLAEAVCQFYLDGVRGEDSGVDEHLWHFEKGKRTGNAYRRNTKQYQAIPSNTKQCQAMPSNVKQYQAIPSNAKQCQAIPSNTKQYQAIPNNTKQCQAMSNTYCWNGFARNASAQRRNMQNNPICHT